MNSMCTVQYMGKVSNSKVHCVLATTLYPLGFKKSSGSCVHTFIEYFLLFSNLVKRSLCASIFFDNCSGAKDEFE